MIILDFGSGNTCRNDKAYIQYMIERLYIIETDLCVVEADRPEIIIKWQLFEQAGDNIPLQHDMFDFAYHYAEMLGYKTTASVFDKGSLSFLLSHDIPFVKIANRPDLYYLAELTGAIKTIVSGRDMFCVSEYPATVEQYEKLGLFEGCNISDHTTNFKLYHKYKPTIYEVHYKLANSTGLDSGDFARTPAQLSEIL